MIFHWNQSEPEALGQIGERGVILKKLSDQGLPLVSSFCLTNAFFRALLEESHILDFFRTAALKQSADQQGEAKKIKDLLRQTQPSEPLLQPVLEAVHGMRRTSRTALADDLHIRLLPSPQAALSMNHEVMLRGSAPFAPTRDGFLKALGEIWELLWTVESHALLNRLKADPVESTGGIIVQEYLPPQLAGVITTHEPETFNPGELFLEAIPPDSLDASRWGTKVFLQRDPLSLECRIKRSVQAHLEDRKANLPSLTKEQILGLASQAVVAGGQIQRSLALHWLLHENFLFISAVDLMQKKTNFFPFHIDQLALFEEERREIKVPPEQPTWALNNYHPLTPMGMSLDYIVIKSINQSTRELKPPYPPKLVRYINGFRFVLSTSDRSPSLLNRVKRFFSKKTEGNYEQDFLDNYLPKYLETIRILENQNMINRTLAEEKLLIEKTLQLIMRFIADTTELRLLVLYENSRDTLAEFQPYLKFADQLVGVCQKLRKPGFEEVLFNSKDWDRIASQILIQENGEELMEQIRLLQDEYGFIWREGDPLDVGARENLNLLVLFLRAAFSGRLSSSATFNREKSGPSLSATTFDHLLYRIIGSFRKIILNTGMKLKTLGFIVDDADIFYFTFDELLSILDSQNLTVDYLRTLKLLILERKRFYANWNGMIPPQYLPEANPTEQEKPTVFRTYTATPVAAGVIEARCRLILSHTDFLRLNPGEIMISPFLTEQIMPIIHMAGGIILDSDTIPPFAEHLIKHHKIPTLINARWASQGIQDGAQILLDAETGRVSVTRAPEL